MSSIRTRESFAPTTVSRPPFSCAARDFPHRHFAAAAAFCRRRRGQMKITVRTMMSQCVCDTPMQHPCRLRNPAFARSAASNARRHVAALPFLSSSLSFSLSRGP